MKKIIFALIFLLAGIFLIMNNVSAACNLDAIMVNQDPSTAIPGEYVKVVFQITGVETNDCGNVYFEVTPEFPFSLDDNQSAFYSFKSGLFNVDYKGFFLAPYKIRIDKDAVDGTNKLKAKFSSNSGANSTSVKTKSFDIEIADVRTDFEVSIKDYAPSSDMLTFQILNTGKHNVNALTIDIPKQDNIEVKGSSRNVVGSLDSNDDTTFNFEGTPREGDINLNILYTDQINVRRSLEKTVRFDSSYFANRKKDVKGTNTTLYIVIIVVIILIAWWFRARHKKKKRMEMHEKSLHEHAKR